MSELCQYGRKSPQAATIFQSAAVCVARAAALRQFDRAAAGSSTTAALLLATAAFLSAAPCFGQGTISLSNRIPDLGIDAKVLMPDGTTPVSDASFRAVLLIGPPLGPLLPSAATFFRTGLSAGYLNPIEVTARNVPLGTEATVVIQEYNGQDYGSSTIRGHSQPIGVLPSGGEPPPPAAPLIGLSGFALQVVAPEFGIADAHWDAGFGVSGSDFGTYATAHVSGNVFYIGGDFSRIGVATADKIAIWDGTQWLPLGAGVNGVVSALALVGTNLYAGGYITMAGGIAANRIARWDGARWHDLSGGVFKTNHLGTGGWWDGAVVHALATDGTNLLVGGLFEHTGTLEAASIAQWNGTAWSRLGDGVKRNPDPPFSGTVAALIWSGGSLYAGGDFRLAGPGNVTNIARWDGRRWHPLGEGVSDTLPVRAIAIGPNEEVFVGGAFMSVGGVEAYGVAKWDGRAWSKMGTGITGGGVTSLAYANGLLLVAGQFTSAGRSPSTNIALWHIPRTVKVDVSNSELILSWPKPDSNFALEASEDLASGSWSAVPTPPALQNNRLTVKEPISAKQTFYRLRQR
ncbi:MAG: hypothetical protein HY735_31210 [Verrucomicrobia bacterium]|nr:hypothetical protein [Verrucomicrobiota bacterium]